MSTKEISNHYKEEVKRLTAKDFMLDSLSRHCASSINLVEALSEKFDKENESVKDINLHLISVINHINKLKNKKT